jgi:hypothetical protein
MLAGKGLNGSMPSGHAAIWAGAAMVAAAYFPRSRKVMFPLAAGVGISRMYVGVHYPSDVLAGWAWGAFYGWGLPRFFEAVWQTVGSRWFPLWHNRVPSLLHVELAGVSRSSGLAPAAKASGSAAELDGHWRRLTWLAIGGLLAARLGYLASAVIELSEDEAYQWLWSKHLDLSYYSKPPFIAYAQWIGTQVWGDRELGVRFLAPVLSAATAWGLSGFVARLAGWRAGFFLVAVLTSMPLLLDSGHGRRLESSREGLYGLVGRDRCGVDGNLPEQVLLALPHCRFRRVFLDPSAGAQTPAASGSLVGFGHECGSDLAGDSLE